MPSFKAWAQSSSGLIKGERDEALAIKVRLQKWLSDISAKRHLCERHLREVGQREREREKERCLYWQPVLT